MNPSLLLIPDRYKKDKLYSQIPDSGAGDLTFARNSNATRVNSAGLIEKVRTNAFTHSEDFTNAVWAPANVAVTANTTTAPNGTLTADSVLSILAFGEHGIRFTTSMAASTEHTVSVFAKQITTRYAYIRDLTNNVVSVFDLQNGVVSLQAAGHVARIEAVGSFYRISITFQTPAIIINNLIDFGITVDGTNFVSTVPVGEGIALWGAQLETGVLTPYIPTTTAAVSVGITADIPRLDYTGGGCPSLLLEPQRTNGAPFSEQFDNAFWGKNESTILANTTATLDPAGYYGADKLQENTVNASHNFGDGTISATSGQTVTFSIFFKAAERTWGALRLYTGSSSIFGWYNLANGTLGTIGAGGTGTIVSYGNGWYRCSLTITMVGNSVTLPFVFTSTGNGVIDYAGTTGSGIYCFGAQHEIGSYPTSYIPTLGSSVTRLADAASKTGISSSIGVNGGSIFVEFDANGLTPSEANYIFDLSDGTNFDEDRIAMYWTGANDLNVFYGHGGTFASATYNFNFATTKKIGVRWTSTQIQVVVNGVAQTAVTYGNSSPTKLNIASRFNDVERLASNIKVCSLYNNTLSTAELITLTTL